MICIPSLTVVFWRMILNSYVFLFDLDATITKKEILPEIAVKINKQKEMKELTERTMAGEIPFDHSFLERVKILSGIPVSDVRSIVNNVPLNNMMADFIRENRERCYVVTGNLDVWIEELMENLNLSGHYFCSHAEVENGYIRRVSHVVDKAEVIKRFAGTPFVAVGDGNNDAEMIAAADIGIGFGGVREIAPAVLKCATHATYSEERLCQFLRQLL